MKLLHSTSISAWQDEHANLLHRACQRTQAAIASGKPIQKTIRRVARSLNGRNFKSDPARRLALSPATMRRAWDKWKHGGRSPAAIALRFKPRYRFIPAPVLTGLVEFICDRPPLRSLAAAWRKYRARRGRGVSKPPKISDFLLRKHFSTARFYRLQGELKSIQLAQTNLDRLRLEAVAEIRQLRVTGRSESTCGKSNRKAVAS